jgi:hypothetical protein
MPVGVKAGVFFFGGGYAVTLNIRIINKYGDIANLSQGLAYDVMIL